MNIYQLVMNYMDDIGNQMANVFHYALDEVGSHRPFDFANLLVNQFQVVNEAAFTPLMGGGSKITSYSAKKVTGGGGPSAILIGTAVGAAGDPCDTSAFAANLQWQTDDPSNRPGHTLIGCVLDTAWVSGHWDTITYQPNVLLFASAMDTPLTLPGGAGNAEFVIYNRKLRLGYVPGSHQLLPKPTATNKRTLPKR